MSIAPQRRQLLWKFRNATKPCQLQNFLFTFSCGCNGIKVTFSRSVLGDSPSCISHASTRLAGYARNERPWVYYRVPFIRTVFTLSDLEKWGNLFPQRTGLLTAFYKSSELSKLLFLWCEANLLHVRHPSAPHHMKAFIYKILHLFHQHLMKTHYVSDIEEGIEYINSEG